MHDPVWVSHPHKSLKVPTTEMTEKRLNSSPGISARGERGIPEIQCPSVTMTVRWEKVRSWKTSSNVSASASSLHLLRFSLARPVISAIGVVKRLFRARAGPGPSPSSAWHCSRTDSDPWWPASWLSGWWRGPAAASAPPRQPASVAPEKKKKKKHRTKRSEVSFLWKQRAIQDTLLVNNIYWSLDIFVLHGNICTSVTKPLARTDIKHLREERVQRGNTMFSPQQNNKLVLYRNTAHSIWCLSLAPCPACSLGLWDGSVSILLKKKQKKQKKKLQRQLPTLTTPPSCKETCVHTTTDTTSADAGRKERWNVTK